MPHALPSTCRLTTPSWFAYISPTEPCLLEDVLITPKHSLVNQVHDHYLPGLVAHDPRDISKDHLITARNVLYNIDGLGIAWYTTSASDFELGNSGESSDGQLKEGLRPAVFKSIQPPGNDMNFRSICANTETRVLMAHIRAASGTAITPVNNHPFVFGRHTFMHNGVVSDFLLIKLDVCQKMSPAAYAAVQGGTDSEHMAALYISFLTNFSEDVGSFDREYSAEEMVSALHATVATILDLQLTKLGPKARPNSLNLCATDGIKMIAYRFRNHATQQPPSLYFSTKAGTTLNRKFPDHPDNVQVPGRVAAKAEEEHGRHIIIASEPSTYKSSDWVLIGKNCVVVASEEHGVVVREVPYKREWDAEDPGAS
jgi:glutamine amidotransferase